MTRHDLGVMLVIMSGLSLPNVGVIIARILFPHFLVDENSIGYMLVVRNITG
jgi:hypothetical protein